jgi:hypothetical protein
MSESVDRTSCCTAFGSDSQRLVIARAASTADRIPQEVRA